MLQAQSIYETQREGNITLQTNNTVCGDVADVVNTFYQNAQALQHEAPEITNVAVACARHQNGYVYSWATATDEATAVANAITECSNIATSYIAEYGQITKRCAVHGIATRDDAALGPVTFVGNFAESSSVARTPWRYHRVSNVVSETGGFLSDGHGEPSSYNFAPAIPVYGDAGWENAPDGEIIAFHGHAGDEMSRLVGLTCLQAFDYVFFDTVVNVPENVMVDTFSIKFEGMDDGSRITIYNAAYPLGTPDMPEGVNNFVRYNENVTMDLVQFLRPGENRVVITQVDDCPAGNKLRRAAVVLNGSEIAATGAIDSVNMTAVQRVSSYMDAHWAVAETVDYGYCGIETGGTGGFGDRPVPTNSHGDVHIFTPDGLTYDYQAGGEFMLVASADHSIAVQTRQTVHVDDPSVSSNSAVALLVGDIVLEFYADGGGQRLYIDGQATDLPTADLALANGGRIAADGATSTATRYIIHWPGDSFQTRVNLYSGFLNVGVAGIAGRYAGLIGNLDGNPKNDMLARGGAALACPPITGPQISAHGDSWRLTQDETLLRAELRPEAEILITEIGGTQRVNLETAIYRVMEQNFAGMAAETSVDTDMIAIILSSMYQVDQAVAYEAVGNLFEQQGYTDVWQTLQVGDITNVVTTYQTTRESRTIDTLDIERRAIAQRICEANGVTDPLALTGCVMDVALTQNEIFVESAQDFGVTLVDLPPAQRFAGSADFNPMAETAILPAARVIELVGAPDVVPNLGRRPALPANLVVTATPSQAPTITMQCLGNQAVTLDGISIVDNALAYVTGGGVFPQNCRGYDLQMVNGDIQLSATCQTPQGMRSSSLSVRDLPAFAAVMATPACQPQAVVTNVVQTTVGDITTVITDETCNAPDPADLLALEPLAGGVAVFCATHARGYTFVHEYGRTLDDALTRVAASCGTAADAMVAQRGDVVIACREVGRAERSFEFGGGEGGVEREVQVNMTTPLIDITAVPPALALLVDPVPALTAACNIDAPVPLRGIGTDNGILVYREDEEGDFRDQCYDISLHQDAEDVVLEATCFTTDGDDIRTSRLSLLGVPAVADVAALPACQVGGTQDDDEPFVAFAEDSLQSDFPAQGDFILIRNDEAGIDVQARRARWTSDHSESVFTGLVMMVGSDVIEVHAMPALHITINGDVFDLASLAGGRPLGLQGGGAMQAFDMSGFDVLWPNTSFMMRVNIFSGSHLVPAIKRDLSLDYYGLARFTRDWQLDDIQSGFTIPLSAEIDCACGE